MLKESIEQIMPEQIMPEQIMPEQITKVLTSIYLYC